MTKMFVKKYKINKDGWSYIQTIASHCKIKIFGKKRQFILPIHFKYVFLTNGTEKNINIFEDTLEKQS